MPATAEVRPARPDDAQALARLMAAEYAHALASGGIGAIPVDLPEHAAALLAYPAHHFWLAELGGELLGFVHLQVQGAAAASGASSWRNGWRKAPSLAPGMGRMVVRGLYVAPAHRQSGLARALVTAAEAAAKAAGYSRLTLSVLSDNALGQKFWVAAGYTTTTLLMAREL